MQSLNSLLSTHPNATFQNAALEAIAMDFVAGLARLYFEVPISADGQQRARGQLELNGVAWWAMEPMVISGGLTINEFGSLPDKRIGPRLKVPANLPEGISGSWFYSADADAYIAFAAATAQFNWWASE